MFRLDPDNFREFVYDARVKKLEKTAHNGRDVSRIANG